MITVLWGIVFGLAVGLTPAGGGLAGVGLLMLGAGLSPPMAVIAALCAGALVGAVGAGDGARSRALDTGVSLWLGGGALIGAPLGALLLTQLPPALWAGLFALAAGLAGLALWPRVAEKPWLRAGLFLNVPRLPAGQLASVALSTAARVKLVTAGAAAATVGALFGAGSGALGRPLVARIAGLPARQTLAATLFLMILTGLAGAGWFWVFGRIGDGMLIGQVVLGAVAGFGFARRLSGYCVAPWFNRLTGLGILVVGVLVAVGGMS